MASSYSPRPKRKSPIVMAALTAFWSIGGGGGGGFVTMTRAVGRCVPPGPVAVSVYVVESCGVTDVEPCAWTLPTPGSKSSSVTFCEDQRNVTDWPFSTVAGSALSEAVGVAMVPPSWGADCRVAIYSPPPPIPTSNKMSAAHIPQRDSAGLVRKGGATTGGRDRSTGGCTCLGISTGGTGGGGGGVGGTATRPAPRSPPDGRRLSLARIKSSDVTTLVLRGFDRSFSIFSISWISARAEAGRRSRFFSSRRMV